MALLPDQKIIDNVERLQIIFRHHYYKIGSVNESGSGRGYYKSLKCYNETLKNSVLESPAMD
ncbi:MAG: hypothetical protein Hyperionvirus3_180 [Hyperionvirus sp.]|uniref:Uncharacterized protein n=1 Tax=Hyperionvirus sp. TaxID=2487770 RepID=A0A3G5A978_9VIRU|nr:MAG: hypothetical protein Hyperionvirus3_180 [Hyperionvirus sp.]